MQTSSCTYGPVPVQFPNRPLVQGKTAPPDENLPVSFWEDENAISTFLFA